MNNHSENPAIEPDFGSTVSGQGLRGASSLPPPDWHPPSTVSGLALQRWSRGGVTPRRSGAKAELGSDRARLAEAIVAGDSVGEYELSKKLARALVSQGAELDTAVKLARRALSLQDDSELRIELAGWYAGLGETALAAATLRPLADALDGKPAARAFTRIAVLLGRSGDAMGAARALLDASQLDTQDPVPLELYGAISGWSPEAVSRTQAAEAYIEACRRRDSSGDRPGAFEDLLRAFDASPSSRLVTERLSLALAARGRAAAADEVLRHHGEALGIEGRAVHLRRMRDAVHDADFARALGAALDAGSDAALDPETVLSVVAALVEHAPLPAVASFDLVLAKTGMHELLSVRLELSSMKLSPERRSEAMALLDRFALQSLGSDAAEDALLLRIRPLLLDGHFAEAMVTLMEALAAPGPRSARAASWLLCIAANQGMQRARGSALSALASCSHGAIAAVLHSVASKELLGAGERARGLKAVEAACHADPTSARAVIAYAGAVLGSTDRVSALAIERAMSMMVPRSHLCRELAAALERLNDLAGALAWTQRWLALCPGDPLAARALLGRAIAARDAQRLADALSWLLAQPQPYEALLADITSALGFLSQIDTERGVALARRALDTFGPRIDQVRGVISDIADWLGERRLSIAVIERQLASGAPGPARLDLLLQLAKRRREGADADGAARALARALHEGAPAEMIKAETDAALAPSTGDGEIALLEVQAELMSRLNANFADTARAWRVYGAALWDLAADQGAALEVWERAAALDPEGGIEQLGRDLLAFAGPSLSRVRLKELAERRSEPRAAARVLAVAAAQALELGERSQAQELALAALRKDPLRADVLAIIERSVSNSAALAESVNELKAAYQLALRAQIGHYGTRSLCYRAARQLERHGECHSALAYAIKAFEAVPAVGVTFVLMVRLGEQLAETHQVEAAIERIAGDAADKERRAEWMRRAALLVGGGDDVVRERVDVLLRALVTSWTVELTETLGVALSAWVRACPEEKEIAALRFERAAHATLKRLTEAHEASVALAFARVASNVFSLRNLAFQAAAVALSLDAKNAEFQSLAALQYLPGDAPWIAEFLNQAVAAIELDPSLATSPLAELLQALGSQVSLPELSERYRLALTRGLAPSLHTTALGGVFSEDEARGVIERALAAESTPELERALGELTTARATLGSESPIYGPLLMASVRVLRMLGDLDQVLPLLTEQLAISDPSTAEYVPLASEVAGLYVARQEVEEAFELLAVARRHRPQERSLLVQAISIARSVGDLRSLRELLAQLVELEHDQEQKQSLRRELAQLLTKVGDSDGAIQQCLRIVEHDRGDAYALGILERDAEQRGDWERMVELLAWRTAVAHSPDEQRAIRMRRARLLEHRLGRPDAARVELERLLKSLGDDFATTQALADLMQRLGDTAHAAPYWERASLLAPDRDVAGQLVLRASRAFLDAGDVGSAKRLLSHRENVPRSQELAELRVEVERRSLDSLGLANALIELSGVVPGLERRTALLLEAAHGLFAAGHLEKALELARRAARIAPTQGSIQLLARRLEYHTRGPGTLSEAQETLVELGLIQGQLTREEEALCVFLRGEAREVCEGSAAAFTEFQRVALELGDLPLVALGLAEHSLKRGEHANAQSYFARALHGDLLGLRSRGATLLLAARAAIGAGDWVRATEYVEQAKSLPDSHGEAIALSAELDYHHTLKARSLGESLRPPGTLRGVAPQALLGFSAGEVLVPEQPEVTRTIPPLAAEKVGRISLRPPQFEPADNGDDREGLRHVGGHSSESAALVGQRTLPSPAEDAHAGKSTASPPSAGPTSSERRVRSSMPPGLANEALLQTALADGSIAAGRDLIEMLRKAPNRTQELVNTCRQFVELLPGDLEALGLLHEAASRDLNLVYARAIEHVMGTFQGKAVVAPALAEQLEQPDQVCALLFQTTHTPAGEILGLVWQWAQQVFQEEPSRYGVTGLERLSSTSPSLVAHVASAAARMLGLRRISVFHKRGAGAPSARVALLNPPAVIVEGEAQETSPVLWFRIGSAFAATLNEHILLHALGQKEVEDVLLAVSAAFGPPELNRNRLASVASMAGKLWERVPSREQRRINALCSASESLSFQQALDAARLASYRAGLFVSGDLGAALSEVAEQEGLGRTTSSDPSIFIELCKKSSPIRDLVRLATRPEYAAARWQVAKQPRRPSSASFSAV